MQQHPLLCISITAKKRKMSPIKSNYVPYIDGLRAVAVVAVIVYHLNRAILPGGFVGVDVFLVISGFVVSASLKDFDAASFGSLLTHFYARRLFRIAPALVVCLLITTIAFVVMIPTALSSGAIEKAGGAAFFGFSNFVLAGTEKDYFSPDATLNPFTHTWSLGVEEQFYLVFPILFFAWLRARRWLSAVAFTGALSVSLLWAWQVGRGQPGFSFYMIYGRFWELAAGVLLLQWLEVRRQRFAALQLAAYAGNFGVGMAAIALGIAFATASPETTPFPGGILPVAGTIGLLAFLNGRSGGGAAAVLESRVFRYVGRISYSLYLWHWPVFVVFRWTVGLQAWGLEFAALLMTFVFASASFHFVETPPRRALAAIGWTRGAVVAFGVGSLALAYGVFRLIWLLQPIIAISTVTRHPFDWYPYGANVSPAYPGCSVLAARVFIPHGSYWMYRRVGCAAPASSARQVFVIGDSHAAAYTAMLKQVTLSTDWQTYVYNIGGCAFIGLRTTPAPICAAYDAAAVADVLSKLHRGDIVLLASRRMLMPGMSANDDVARQGWTAALPVLRTLVAAGARIIFEAPTPEFASPAFRCADWYDQKNPVCRTDTVDWARFAAAREPVLIAYRKFQTVLPGIMVWDPAATLCDHDKCHQFRNGRPLFFDDNHLSGYADMVLLPGFEHFIAVTAERPIAQTPN